MDICCNVYPVASEYNYVMYPITVKCFGGGNNNQLFLVITSMYWLVDHECQ